MTRKEGLEFKSGKGLINEPLDLSDIAPEDRNQAILSDILGRMLLPVLEEWLKSVDTYAQLTNRQLEAADVSNALLNGITTLYANYCTDFMNRSKSLDIVDWHHEGFSTIVVETLNAAYRVVREQHLEEKQHGVPRV